MALPLALLVLLRLAVSRLIPGPAMRLAISSLLLASFAGCMLLYYGLVLISLNYWGGVVAWNVIPTFFRQAPDMADALHVPKLAIAVGTAALAAALIAASWFYLGRFDWTHQLRRAGWLTAISATGGFAILWVQAAGAAHAPWISESEPLSMTLFPLAGARDIEGHRVTAPNAELLDEAEDRARAAYVTADKSPKQNLILIVVDALRPDHMSLFGYQRKTTPYLDGLARTQNVRKLVAHAPCGDTVCGLLSLTGSKLPRDFSFRPFGIHEVLRRNGYRVHMILSGDHSFFHPIKDYYGPVDSWFDGNSVHSSASIDDDQPLIDRLASMPSADGTPTMFQFHLMSAHVTRRDDGKGVFLPARAYVLEPRSDDGGLDQTLPSATNFYDNGVLGADVVIEKLLDLLEQKGYLRRALVVITADHGESLGEHGIFGHANSVREELLKVPAVFIAYGYAADRSITGASLPLQIDVAPTILRELQIPQPATWKGRPLQDSTASGLTYFEERAYSGLIDTRQAGREWKYWVDRLRGGEFAFDLKSDPRETHNLIASVPRSVLGDWRQRVLYTMPQSSAALVARSH